MSFRSGSIAKDLKISKPLAGNGFASASPQTEREEEISPIYEFRLNE
jgi:hypothetical protein